MMTGWRDLVVPALALLMAAAYLARRVMLSRRRASACGCGEAGCRDH